MLCNVKRPDDVTTAELNPVDFSIRHTESESIRVDFSQL